MKGNFKFFFLTNTYKITSNCLILMMHIYKVTKHRG